MIWLILGLCVIVCVALIAQPRPTTGVPSGHINAAAPDIPFACGDGTYGQMIVGEASYQREIEQIAGPKTEDGHDLKATATLTPEPTNPYDSKAVRVDIAGLRVGYIAKTQTARHHTALAKAGLKGQAVQCDARIIGGWKRSKRKGEDEGHYGVELDLTYPIRLK